MRQAFRFIICFYSIFLLLIISTPQCFSFGKQKRTDSGAGFKKNNADSYPSYRIFYLADKESTPDLSTSDPPKKWVKLRYKIVDMSEAPGGYFGSFSGGKVLFLDRDHFAVASDYFLTKDAVGTDLYKALLIEEAKVSKIIEAKIEPMGEGDLERAHRQEEAEQLQHSEEEKTYLQSIGKLKPDPVEFPIISESHKKNISLQTVSDLSVSPAADMGAINKTADSTNWQMTQPAASTTQNHQEKRIFTSEVTSDKDNSSQDSSSDINLKKKQTLDKNLNHAENRVTGVKSQDKMSSGNAKKNNEEVLGVGGVTNDDVKKELGEVDKNPATKVPESPSTLPESPGSNAITVSNNASIQ